MTSAIPFPPTRWSLIGRVPAGAGDAAVVIERYADCLHRYLRARFHYLAPADCDDLVQDVLLRLLEHPNLFSGASPREGGKFRYFLATVALNQARNLVRTQQRTHHREHPLHADHVAEISAEDPEVDHAWQQSVLALAWADLRGWATTGELEPEIPQLLEEHLVAEISLRELAKRHDIPLATCQRRIAKGRTWLQRAILSRGAAQSQGIIT